jgi:ankyrin repeat protein
MTQQETEAFFFAAILEGRADDVRSALRDNPALIDASYVDGDDPLSLAIGCDWPEVVDVLLEHGVDVDALTTDGSTPLSSAEGRAMPIFLRRHRGVS